MQTTAHTPNLVLEKSVPNRVSNLTGQLPAAYVSVFVNKRLLWWSGDIFISVTTQVIQYSVSITWSFHTELSAEEGEDKGAVPVLLFVVIRF